MRKRLIRTAAAACFLGLVPAAVQAQEAQPTRPNQAVPRAGQTLTPGQPGATANQQQGDQQYQARRVSPTANAQQHDLESYLTTVLMLGNLEEIQLGQLATQKSQHDQVKQFAQKLIQGHQQLNQKLQQLQSGHQQGAGQQPGAGQLGQNEQNAQQERFGAANEQRDALDRPTRGGAEMHRGQNVPAELTQITQQAGQRHLQMVTQMLQQKSGQNFDMGFLAIVIADHTWMLSELQAIQAQRVGSQQFQQTVQQAAQATQEHLNEAQQLAKQFENDRQAANAGSRSSNSGTQSGNRSGGS